MYDCKFWRSNVASEPVLQYATRSNLRRKWGRRVLMAVVVMLPPALIVSHFWPFGATHYYAIDLALTRDRSEIALINGTLSLKYSRVSGTPQNARVKGHLALVGGYRAMFLPGDRPIERPWALAATCKTTPLVGGSMVRAFVVIPLWPVWVVLVGVCVWRIANVHGTADRLQSKETPG